MLGTVAAVVVVHSANLRYRLVLDDFAWLDESPSSVEEVLQGLRPATGTGIYRPLLDLWFDAINGVFGIHPLPYHVFALAAVGAAALAVRWLSLELGLAMLPATISGIVVGSHGALAITTMWVSSVGAPMMIAFAASAIAVVARRGLGRQLLAALFLVLAIMWRDSAVVTPVVATILFVARPSGRLRVASALQSTVGLWVVALAYGLLRVTNGLFDATSDDPYRSALGGHVVSNFATLAKYTARFGVPRSDGNVEAFAMVAIVIVFWAALVGGAVWAGRRHSYLPAAGLVTFLVGIVPFVGLTSHSMETYYIEAAVIGLAVAIGGILDATSLRPGALIAIAVMFVGVQMVAVQFVHSRVWVQGFIARTDILEDYARRAPIRDGVLVVEEACALDPAITKHGAFFRVILEKPDLRVRYHVLDTGTPPTTRWGCRVG